MLGLRARSMVVAETVHHDDHLCACQLFIASREREHLPRGPEGAGSEGALSLP